VKRRVIRICWYLLALGAAGFLVAASGIIPIRASSGHWAITQWFLRFSMQRSIATHSIGTEVPMLDDARLVLKGAGHYEIGCRSCHGAPGSRPPRIAQAMLPRAPDLISRIQESNPKKLFQVVKHGLKFTGMPAWPSQQRDDEVWAVVAFLVKMPEMNGSEYARLIRGEPPSIPAMQNMPATLFTSASGVNILQSCARCHGSDGLGRGNGAFPRLAGQRHAYFVNTMKAYARGRRHSGIMEPVAAALTDELVQNLATYFAQLEPAQGVGASDALSGEISQGRQIAEHGIPDRRVPACVECHGPKGKRTKAAYPSLAGQSADYLLLQLQLFKEEKRGGTDYAHLMDEVAPKLKPDEMRAVARYFESLPMPSSE
jgi:cytochrome c553